MKKILIFNVNWLGDVLFSTAVIRNLRYNFPGSYIACIIPPRCQPVLSGNPYLDEIIIYDEKGCHKGLFGRLNFVKTLKAKGFDIVFLLHRSFTRALIARLAGIPERVGYHTGRRGFLLTKKIYPPKKDIAHRAEYYLNIISSSGLAVVDRHLDFFTFPEDIKFVDNLLAKEGIKNSDFLVVLNPGGNWLPKRWPRGHWARLADGLITKFNAKVVISGSKQDLSLAVDIKAMMRQRPFITAGVLNIKHLSALCKRADLFITADTGPLHIAHASGAKKIIALFGPTSSKITGPVPLTSNVVILHKDTGCVIPCYRKSCKDSRCMKAITPEEVLEAIKP